MQTIQLLVETSATVSTIMMFLTHLPLALKYHIDPPKSALTHLSTLLNCTLWLKYGILTSQAAIFVGTPYLIQVIAIANLGTSVLT